eukprot:gene1148-1313_t
MLHLGLRFFELTGQSIFQMYDTVISFPEFFSRQIRRKNGVFYKVTRVLWIMAASSSGSSSAGAPPPAMNKTPSAPPPPPPMPPMTKSSSVLKINRGNSGTSSAPIVNATPTKQMLSIGDAIRGSGKVTLKKSDVIRSPGGTPIRDITNQPRSALSTQDFIAIALKKKFQNVNIKQEDSPERRPSRHTNDSFFSDSDNDDSFADYADDNKENNRGYLPTPINQ